ncbi:hypothetical protein CMV_002591 [Castanea mollissima]|uniref:Uncharacterized protein n=1 Tax=Castanea mollissima TaxID=60419 RepID=A0A8J4S1K8_9ROSI|nr:hypothetical protein CMV_002591 [Castanea mollissima]
MLEEVFLWNFLSQSPLMDKLWIGLSGFLDAALSQFSCWTNASRRLDASPLSSRRSAWLTSAAVAGAHNHWLTAGPRQTTEIASVFPTSIGGGSKHRCVDDDE